MIVAAGIQGVNWGVVVSKIILPAVVAPFVAGTASGLATWVAYKIVPSDEEAYTNKIFKIAQRFFSFYGGFLSRHIRWAKNHGCYHPGVSGRRLPGGRHRPAVVGSRLAPV